MNHRTPAWLWVVAYLALIGVFGVATRGYHPATNQPPGDVNCINGVYEMGCVP